MINTTLTGDVGVRAMFAVAPEQYRRSLLHWMIIERRRFVGDKKRDGSFRKSILNKKLAGRSGNWPLNIARGFKGYITGERDLSTMKMEMGYGIHKATPFKEGIAQMEETHTVSMKDDFLIVPIWENIKQRYGTVENQHKKFLSLLQGSEADANFGLEMIRKRGMMFFFDKRSAYGGGESKLLWIGVRQARVKKQLNFYGSWGRIVPSALNRGQDFIDRTTERLAR